MFIPRFLCDIKITCTIRVLSLRPRPTLKKLQSGTVVFQVAAVCSFLSLT